jgi:hypothetical protein
MMSMSNAASGLLACHLASRIRAPLPSPTLGGSTITQRQLPKCSRHLLISPWVLAHRRGGPGLELVEALSTTRSSRTTSPQHVPASRHVGHGRHQVDLITDVASDNDGRRIT